MLTGQLQGYLRPGLPLSAPATPIQGFHLYNYLKAQNGSGNANHQVLSPGRKKKKKKDNNGIGKKHVAFCSDMFPLWSLSPVHLSPLIVQDWVPQAKPASSKKAGKCGLLAEYIAVHVLNKEFYY